MCQYIYIYTIHFNRETNPPKNSWNHPPLPSAINPCVFVSVESKVLRPTCHPNQLPAIHRFLFPHRWSTLPLHQGPGGKKKQRAFFIFGSLALKSKIDVMKGFLKKKRPQGVQPPLLSLPQSFPLHEKRGRQRTIDWSLFSKSGLERFWDNRGNMLLACWIGIFEKRSVKKFSKKKKHSLVWVLWNLLVL